jgi:DNA (cytosine-5)-methyltransferase 1
MEYAADHFQKMIKDTEALGYTTTYKVLRGHDYGVPQKRERVFMVSVRDDVLKDVGLNFMNLCNVFPDPETHEPTVRDAIEDLQDDPNNKEEALELIELMRTSSKGKWIYGFDTHPDYPNSGPCKGLKGVDYNGRVLSIGDNVVGPWFKEQVARGIIKPEDEKHSYYMSRIVPWDQAAHSLTEQGLQPKFMGGNHMHPDEYRVYTPTEAKRIMSLPEDYKLTGTIDQKQARIGLMVAPLCMKYLADSIYDKIIKVYNEIHKN